MKILVKDFANGKFNDLSSQLTDSTIERVRMFQKENVVEITLHTYDVLSFEDYSSFCYGIEEMTGCHIQLLIHSDQCNTNIVGIKKYLSYLAKIHGDYSDLAHTVFTYDSDSKTISFLLNSQEDVERSSVYVNDIENDLALCGLPIHVKCITNAPHVEDVREVVMNVIPEKEQTIAQKPVEKKKNNYDRKRIVRSCKRCEPE